MMQREEPGSPDRQRRRKERTRAALVQAAREILREGRDGHASIQNVTDLADVGFGSFYNHFASKQELFDAAVASAVADYTDWLDRNLAEDDATGSRLIASIRLTGRLAIVQPETAQILGRHLSALAASGQPLGERIRADIRDALKQKGAGGSSPWETETLTVAALGAIQAVLHRVERASGAEVEEAADVLAEAIARLLRVE
jgi:AcrR family transcriptional regulator